MRASCTTISLACLALIAGGCKLEPPFERTNPYDTGGIVKIDMLGPDTIHSRGERFQMQLVGDPALPADLLVTWQVLIVEKDPASTANVEPLFGGAYFVDRASAIYERVELSALLHDRVVGKVIYVGQRAATVSLSCAPSGQPYRACDATPVAPGAPITVYTTLTDALGYQIARAGVALARGSLASRDPSVAVAVAEPLAESATSVRFAAVGAGTTWLVVRVDDAVDSVRVTVRP